MGQACHREYQTGNSLASTTEYASCFEAQLYRARAFCPALPPAAQPNALFHHFLGCRTSERLSEIHLIPSAAGPRRCPRAAWRKRTRCPPPHMRVACFGHMSLSPCALPPAQQPAQGPAPHWRNYTKKGREVEKGCDVNGIASTKSGKHRR